METLFINTDKHLNIDFQLMSFDSAISIKTKDQPLTKVLPANEFIAPEVFIGRYGRKIDEYGAGVVMYYLLCEEMPYKFAKLKSDQEIYWYLKK